MLSLITQLGLVMIVSIGMATAVGIWLDKKLGTSWLMVLFFFAGAIAGGKSVYQMIQKTFDDGDGKSGGK